MGIEDVLTDFFEKEPGVLHWGVAKASRTPNSHLLEQWVGEGLHAGLRYMEKNLPKRVDPSVLFPWGKSVILFSLQYEEPIFNPSSRYKVARYAAGLDYHFRCREILNRLGNKLREQFNYPIQTFGFVDTAPVFERDLAAEAALGWRGKNCCVIHPEKGSYFFISGILLDQELNPSQPLTDFCGTCTRCLESCPTDAFMAPGKLDTSKCISYWTIEQKGEIPRDQKFHGWIFGCDVCQEVCPWNEKRARNEPASIDENLPNSAREWLEILRHGGSFNRRFKNSALKRAGRKWLLRNLLRVMGENKDWQSDLDDFKKMESEAQVENWFSQLNESFEA